MTGGPREDSGLETGPESEVLLEERVPESDVVPAIAVSEADDSDDDDVVPIPDTSEDILSEHPLFEPAAAVSASDHQPGEAVGRSEDLSAPDPPDEPPKPETASVEAQTDPPAEPEAAANPPDEDPPSGDEAPTADGASERLEVMLLAGHDIPVDESEAAEAETEKPEPVPEPTPAGSRPEPVSEPTASGSLPEPAAAMGFTLDSLTDGLLLDFEAPSRRPSSPPPEPSGAELPAFEAAPAAAEPDGFPEIDGPELDAFPEPATVPFAVPPAPAEPRPSRVRPEVRVPRKSELDRVPRPQPSPRAIGIDLGTTNCCAAVVQDGRAYVLASRVGTSTMPSAVCFSDDGDVLVGRDALTRAVTDPLNTITGAKRLVGRPFHSPVVQNIRSHFAFAIVEGEGGEAAVDIGDGDVITLEEVSAYMLREIRESASLLLGERVTRAVITCPAFYNERQREAVRIAGELAGLIVERVLSEPTAAALNHGYGRDLGTRRVAVYDLGGGTFDVSILEVDGSVYEVLATGGDTFLGGIDFDATIARLAVERIVAEGKPDPREDAAAIARLMEAAEQAKRSLTERPSTILHVGDLRVGRHAPFDVTLPLRRTEVDPALAPLLERTAGIVEDVCQRAGLKAFEVDDVLLVGGQTRYPAVAEHVAKIFGRAPRASINPDEAVALGASQYAAGMHTIDNVVLIDALPMSIGVGLAGGRFLPVLSRDQRLPAEGSCLLPTSKKNQKSMEVWFFQGEGPSVAETDPLGRLEIEGLPPGPIGATTVIVEARVNGESILEVRARDQVGGRTFSSRFATKSTPEALRDKLGLPEPPAHGSPAPGFGPTRVWSWLTSLFR